MVYNGSYKVMSNIPKSWDSYQPQVSGFSLVPYDLDGPDQMHFDSDTLGGADGGRSWPTFLGGDDQGLLNVP